MQNIAKSMMLLRGRIELPDGLRLETEAFRSLWRIVQSGDVYWLDKTVRACGWHFIWIGEAVSRHGIGKKSEAAVARALNITLRKVDEQFNAAVVESIEAKKYLWFFIALVKVYPYQIQHGATLSSAS